MAGISEAMTGSSEGIEQVGFEGHNQLYDSNIAGLVDKGGGWQLLVKD